MKAGVPCVPGSDGLINDVEEAVKIADRIGYPVLIKATAGGGGKGMRVAGNEISLRAGLQAASAEAEKAFKNAGVYLEKYVERPRHIEVQILADTHGNVVHLWNATAQCSGVTRSSSKKVRLPTARSCSQEHLRMRSETCEGGRIPECGDR